MAGANSGNNNSGHNSADPFEEFEFRPINEGLGFHRKQKNQSMNTIPQTGASSSSHSFQSPLPRPESRVDLASPSLLNRKGNSFQVPTIEDDSIAKAQTAVNDILKSLNQKRQLDFATETTRLKGEAKKSKPYFFAATLDTMLITASFLMSLILMLLITKVDLFMNLTHPRTSGLVYLATAALFLGVTFIYMVVNRSFLGATPGEWAFEQTCGSSEQSEKISYIPRVALRTILVTITGFITLPMLSYLFNKDIAGDISGVSLYKKPNA